MARSTGPIRTIREGKHFKGTHTIIDEDGEKGTIYLNTNRIDRRAINRELQLLANDVALAANEPHHVVEEHINAELQAGRSLPLSSRL